MVIIDLYYYIHSILIESCKDDEFRVILNISYLIVSNQHSHLTMILPSDSFPEMYFNLRPLLLDGGEDRRLM